LVDGGVNNNTPYYLGIFMNIKPRQWARQYTSRSNIFEFNDTKWKVKGGDGGLNKRHLARLFLQMDIMLTKYSKVCVIQFDLHMLEYTSDNNKMAIFKRRLLGQVSSKYKISERDIAYFWCREYEKGKGQHYHWAVIVDGKKVRSGYPTNAMAKLAWEQMDGTFHARQYHNVSRTSLNSQCEVMDHLSYLAKVRTKGYAGDKVKSFSSSKLKYSDGNIDNSKGLYTEI
jgi:hypothetical protein